MSVLVTSVSDTFLGRSGTRWRRKKKKSVFFCNPLLDRDQSRETRGATVLIRNATGSGQTYATARLTAAAAVPVPAVAATPRIPERKPRQPSKAESKGAVGAHGENNANAPLCSATNYPVATRKRSPLLSKRFRPWQDEGAEERESSSQYVLGSISTDPDVTSGKNARGKKRKFVPNLSLPIDLCQSDSSSDAGLQPSQISSSPPPGPARVNSTSSGGSTPSESSDCLVWDRCRIHGKIRVPAVAATSAELTSLPLWIKKLVRPPLYRHFRRCSLCRNSAERFLASARVNGYSVERVAIAPLTPTHSNPPPTNAQHDPKQTRRAVGKKSSGASLPRSEPNHPVDGAPLPEASASFSGPKAAAELRFNLRCRRGHSFSLSGIPRPSPLTNTPVQKEDRGPLPPPSSASSGGAPYFLPIPRLPGLYSEPAEGGSRVTPLRFVPARSGPTWCPICLSQASFKIQQKVLRAEEDSAMQRQQQLLNEAKAELEKNARLYQKKSERGRQPPVKGRMPYSRARVEKLSGSSLTKELSGRHLEQLVNEEMGRYAGLSREQAMPIVRVLNEKDRSPWNILRVRPSPFKDARRKNGGIESETLYNEIKSSYRELARRVHPDKNPHPRANEAFLLIDNAWRTLSTQLAQCTKTSSDKKYCYDIS